MKESGDLWAKPSGVGLGRCGRQRGRPRRRPTHLATATEVTGKPHELPEDILPPVVGSGGSGDCLRRRAARYPALHWRLGNEAKQGLCIAVLDGLNLFGSKPHISHVIDTLLVYITYFVRIVAAEDDPISTKGITCAA